MYPLSTVLLFRGWCAAQQSGRGARRSKREIPHAFQGYHAVTALAAALLFAFSLAGLAMIPLGLPGLWVMVGGILIYGWLTGFRSMGVPTIGIVLGLAFVGEIIENWIGFRYAKRYGGSTRSGWGALIGGLVGAAIGVPVAIIGSVIGAFLGSFLGAALFEYTYSRHA